jgi:hypothetical protein
MPDPNKITNPRSPVPPGNRAAIPTAAPFSITQLLEIWNHIQLGEYWPAFQKTVALLNSVINPAIGATASETPVSDEDRTKIEGICCKLEEWCEENGNKRKGVESVTHEVAGATVGFSLQDLAAMLAVLAQFLQGWRKSE